MPETSRTSPTKDVQTSRDKHPDVQKASKRGTNPENAWYERTRTKGKVTLRPNDEVLQRIKVFCVQRKWDLSYFFEVAGIRLIDSLDVRDDKSPDAKTSLDDRGLKINWKTVPPIINLYLQYNPKNKWTVNDDEAAFQFNEVDIRVIELAIIQTQFNAQFKRINSFKYYISEIETWSATALPEQTLDAILDLHRQRWNAAANNKQAQSKNKS